MPNLEQTVQYMERLCNDDRHGYSQVRRWAGQGNDRDCSSAVIDALRQGGFDTGAASYTGRKVCAQGDGRGFHLTQQSGEEIFY